MNTIQPNYILFKNNKYTKWYYNIVNNSLNRASSRKEAKELLGYVEGHHIIPRCLSGNIIVFLTAKEHFICHLLLCKMCVERNHEFKMLNAFAQMQRKGPGQSRYVSAIYSYFKIKYAKFKSETQKGGNNPNFGNKWSDEQKQRMSEITKNRITDEYRKMMSNAQKNRPPITEETRRKISIAGTGRIVSDDTKKILSENKKGAKNPMYGNSKASDHLRKYSEERKGKPRDKSETEKSKRSRIKNQCFKLLTKFNIINEEIIVNAKKLKIIPNTAPNLQRILECLGDIPISIEHLNRL